MSSGEYILKIMYDVQNNRKITVTVSPDVDDSNAVTQKFYPTDKAESYYYESEEIVPDPDSLSDTSQFYYYSTHPSGEIYSLLRNDVSLGENPLDSIDDDDIIFGIKPILESAMYSSADLRNFGVRYGLVYKNEIYDSVISKIHSEVSDDCEDDPFLESINKQRNLQQFIFKVSGKILQQSSSLYESNNGGIIKGYKYSSPDLYAVDYYNDILIPTYTKTVADKNSSTIISSDPTSDNPDPEETRLISKVIDHEYFTYKYYGTDPLPKKITKTTYLKLPFGINKKSFRIIAFTGSNSEVTAVYIANYSSNESDYEVKMTDTMKKGYVVKTYNDVNFYRPFATERDRYEDVIQATWNGVDITYNCSGGLGKFDALHSILAIGNVTKLASQLTDTVGSDASKYEIAVGNRLLNLKDFDEAQSNNGGTSVTDKVVDITDLVSAKLEFINVSTSYTTHKPCGKNKSFNTISSQKIVPTGQDFDSKTYIGGGLPLKTYTYPDTIAHIIIGEDGLVKNIQAGGTFASKGELEVVASNFYESNSMLAQVTITLRGLLDINDIGDYYDTTNLVIDKVTYDYATNSTVINGRSMLDY